MESIKEIFRIGLGPSSSHTMGPRFAAERFLQKVPQAQRFEVTLYGSLAATGRGHLTDIALEQAFTPAPIQIHWQPEIILPEHPNGMHFCALDNDDNILAEWTIFSVGGGALFEAGQSISTKNIYTDTTLQDIMNVCARDGIAFWEYVFRNEDEHILPFLEKVAIAMAQSVKRGLQTEGVLPGGLGLARKAHAYHQKARLGIEEIRQAGLLAAYALAVAEENAAGGIIVTAPTCGSCGVVPAVLTYLQKRLNCHKRSIIQALATAGLIGSLIRLNASISGAEVGCQGEIGSACAMAAAAATQLMGGSIRQIEYAAEMGLEHHLGLTCDPVNGLVQIPCIERNAYAASRALNCARMALLSDGNHCIPFDEVVRVMKETGHDLPSLYRETSCGGLAKIYNARTHAHSPQVPKKSTQG